MTIDTITTLRNSAEAFVQALNDAAKAMEPKDDTPPVPPIPERYASEFAHEEPPRYDYPKDGEWVIAQDHFGHPFERIWRQNGPYDKRDGKRWILRRLPDRPPMPAPAGECWWCESQKRWITVEDMYHIPLDEVPISEGHQVESFRSPKKGETYQTAFAGGTAVAADDHPDTFARLILRPIPPAPQRRKFTAEEIFNNELSEVGAGKWQYVSGVPCRIVEQS